MLALVNEMTTMDRLCIEIQEITKNNKNIFYTTIESFLALYVYKYLDSPSNIKLCFVRTSVNEKQQQVRLREQFINHNAIEPLEDLFQASTDAQLLQDLRLPIYACDDNTLIAGMCAVCREIIARQPNLEHRKLLGFKSSCLQSSSEASIWTRFCEVDIIQALLKTSLQRQVNEILTQLPVELVRLERHMNEPVRMHNIYKTARLQNKDTADTAKAVCVPKETLDIAHRFVEGVAFSLADLILYPCVQMLLVRFLSYEKHMPLTHSWLKEIDTHYPMCAKILDALHQSITKCSQVANISYEVPDAAFTSLYKSDPKRYKPRDRLFTVQKDVELAISELTRELPIKFCSNSPISYDQPPVNWQEVVSNYEATSPLPANRIKRKHQQLENMANAVISVAKPNSRIVDFCSGTGHLGLLLACMLPTCKIIFLENKAFALNHAKLRASKLGLKNCLFYQCNIDYFVGNFDIGTSLHACGSATDIVLQQCMRARAAFVCSPCCYGGLQTMPHISYPRSKEFRSALDNHYFMNIAHAADQAHELGTKNCTEEISRQGQLCMDIVDTDRMLHAQDAGYDVILTRFKPENCTQKNRLIVGRPILLDRHRYY